MTAAIAQKLNNGIRSLFKDNAVTTGIASDHKHLTYADFLANKILIIKIIRQGIPYSFFNLILQVSPFSENEWAGILDISTKSLQRYKQSTRHFKPTQTEKIIEIAEVSNLGMEIFDDMEKFKLWLNTPNFALGNIKPSELLKDSYGKEMVVSELTRINHGIFV
jgi:putative toxin-antitoxin system antitoxin component (TIGR02293 family)